MLMLRWGRIAQFGGSPVDLGLSVEVPAERLRRGDATDPWRPPLEVYEVADELVVRVEIAGIAVERLDVAIDRGELTIRGERHISPCGEPRRFHESRIRYGAFLVTVRLPFPVDERAASADYRDGLLSIRLPRLAATRIVVVDRVETAATE